MISRGEVALIVAQKGAAVGLISTSMFPAIVLVVIVTTLVTPILLKMVMTRDPVIHRRAQEHKKTTPGFETRGFV